MQSEFGWLATPILRLPSRGQHDPFLARNGMGRARLLYSSYALDSRESMVSEHAQRPETSQWHGSGGPFAE